MRKIIFFLLLSIPFIGVAQTKTVVKVGGAQQIIVNGATASDSVSYVPSGCGAPTIDMSNYISKKRASAFYVDTCADVAYFYSISTNTWITFAAGSIPTWDAVLAQQGTDPMTGDYISNFDNHYFQWNGINQFLVNGTTYNGGLFKIDDAGVVSLGDISNDFNGTRLFVDDAAQQIRFYADGYVYDNVASVTNPDYIATWSGSNLSQTSLGDLLDPILAGDGIYPVEDSTNTPPVSFPVGQDSVYYLIGGSPTGAWSGEANKIALYVSGVLDSFIPGVVGDYAITLDDGVWHRYNGSTWPVTYARSWLIGGNFGGGVIGSTNSAQVFLRYNNTNRIILGGGANAVRFPTMGGASAGIMGLATNGVGSNVQIGTGLDLTAGVLSATGSSPTFQQTLITGSAMTQNNTVTGAYTFTWGTSRFIVGATDSISLTSANDAAINTSGIFRVRAVTIDEKATTAQFGATTAATFTTNTGTDSAGFSIWNNKIHEKRIVSGTGPFVRIATDSSLVYSTAVTLTTDVTGILPVANGGTGLSSVTANEVVIGNGSSALTTVSGTGASTGYYLKFNSGSAPTWASASGLSPFTRGALPSASATLNVIYPTTQTDTVFIGSTGDLSSNKPRALFNVNGTSRFAGNITSNGSDATGFTGLQAGRVGLNGTVHNNSYLIYASNHASAKDFYATGNVDQASNPNFVGIEISTNSTNTSSGATSTVSGFKYSLTQSNNSGLFAKEYTGFEANMTYQSQSSTPTANAWAFKATQGMGNGSNQLHKITNAYNFLSTWTNTDTLIGTAMYSFYADSALANTYAGGAYYPFFNLANSTGTQTNVFQSRTLIGSGTTIDASAQLEVKSTTKGFRITPMTATQASAITPSEGLMVFTSDTNGTFTSIGFWGYENGAWHKL